MSVSERHAAKRLFFGVVTGAAAGALMAYGGGAFGLAGLWWCPGDCR